VLHLSGVKDQPVTAAVRPEGFILSENGALTCDLRGVEVMGRDISVVCGHDDCENAAIRAIIPSENSINPSSGKVRFDLKPDKLFLFDAENENRIPFETV